MDAVFRRATPADAPAMARLTTDAWRKAYRGIISDAFLDGLDPEKRSECIRETIETKDDFWHYVLEDGGELVGVSGLCKCGDGDLKDAGEIMVFYIRTDLQGQGYGRLMMRHALDALQEKGFRRIALWVLTENRAGRAFYEAAGFQPDGAEKTLPFLEDAHTVRYQLR